MCAYSPPICHFLIFLSLFQAILFLILRRFETYVAILGFVALGLESTLPIPQLIRCAFCCCAYPTCAEHTQQLQTAVAVWLQNLDAAWMGRRRCFQVRCAIYSIDFRLISTGLCTFSGKGRPSSSKPVLYFSCRLISVRRIMICVSILTVPQPSWGSGLCTEPSHL